LTMSHPPKRTTNQRVWCSFSSLYVLLNLETWLENGRFSLDRRSQGDKFDSQPPSLPVKWTKLTKLIPCSLPLYCF
jgi:hypothetical protein